MSIEVVALADEFRKDIDRQMNDMRAKMEEEMKKMEERLLSQLRNLEQKFPSSDTPTPPSPLDKAPIPSPSPLEKAPIPSPSPSPSPPEEAPITSSPQKVEPVPRKVGLDDLLALLAEEEESESTEADSFELIPVTSKPKLTSWKSIHKLDSIVHTGIRMDLLTRSSPRQLDNSLSGAVRNSSRTIAAHIYNEVSEIQMKDVKRLPKKYKDAFTGQAAISHILESMNLTSREAAVVLCKSIFQYLVCANVLTETSFKDSPDYYYRFSTPVFSSTEKMEKELPPSITAVLGNDRANGVIFQHFFAKNQNTIKRHVNVMELEIEICAQANAKKKKWIPRLATLSPSALCIYKGSDSTSSGILQSIPLKAIKRVLIDESVYNIMDIVRDSCKGALSRDISFIVHFLLHTKKTTLLFRAPSGVDSSVLLALMMDGLRYQHRPLLDELNGTCIDTSLKILLLRTLFKSRQKGGIVNSNDEEWQYNSDGSVRCIAGNRPFSYTWTGCFLQPSIHLDCVNVGTGKWDGANLWWFPPSTAADGVKNTIGDLYYAREATIHYLYDHKKREYINQEETKQWKWSRHFLASMEKEKEWIVEGDIPEPVVMLLQLMRYHLMSECTPKCQNE